MKNKDEIPKKLDKNKHIFDTSNWDRWKRVKVVAGIVALLCIIPFFINPAGTWRTYGVIILICVFIWGEIKVVTWVMKGKWGAD